MIPGVIPRTGGRSCQGPGPDTARDLQRSCPLTSWFFILEQETESRQFSSGNGNFG